MLNIACSIRNSPWLQYSLCISPSDHGFRSSPWPAIAAIAHLIGQDSSAIEQHGLKSGLGSVVLSIEFRDLQACAMFDFRIGYPLPTMSSWFYIPLNQQRPITRLSHYPGRYPHEYPMKNHHFGWLNLPYAWIIWISVPRHWEVPWDQGDHEMGCHFSVSLSGL